MISPVSIGILAVFVAVAYFIGREHGAKGPNEELVRLEAKSEAQKERYDVVIARLSVNISKLHEIANRRSEEVKAVIRRPAYREPCLDDAGMRLANDALTNGATGTDDPLSAFDAPAK